MNQDSETSDIKSEFLHRELRMCVDADDAKDRAVDLQRFDQWATTVGKDPKQGKGLAENTVDNYVHLLNQVLKYATRVDLEPAITPSVADAYLEFLSQDQITKCNGEPYSETSKRKRSDALEKYLLYRTLEHGEDDWTPPVNFTDGYADGYDPINNEEVEQLVDAAEEYWSLKSYYSVSREERQRTKSLIAERKNTSADDVSPADWEKYDRSAKYSSLVKVAYEAGLIPEDINSASVSWIREDENMLVIPTTEGAKERELTKVALTEDAMSLLQDWLRERECYEKYDDSDRIWLNHDGNPFNSKSLCYRLQKLIDIADITPKNRNFVWYSLRKGIANEIRTRGDEQEAADQLRHSSTDVFDYYADTSVEERRQTIEEIENGGDDVTLNINGDEIELENLVDFVNKFA